MANFTIKRRKWRCGGNSDKRRNKIGGGTTCLLNGEGEMCCLGQIAEQSGVKRDKLLDVGTPAQIYGRVPYLNRFDTRRRKYLNTRLSDEAIAINDNEKITVAEKIEKLTELFDKHGHTLKFE